MGLAVLEVQLFLLCQDVVMHYFKEGGNDLGVQASGCPLWHCQIADKETLCLLSAFSEPERTFQFHSLCFLC